MNFGIIKGETIDEYHASPATSHSKLEVLRDPDRGPARYHGMFVTGHIPRESRKDHFDVGNAVDVLLTQGKRAFRKAVKILPRDFNGRTNEGKEEISLARACGKIVLDFYQGNLVEHMANIARANRDFAALLRRGRTGLTIRAKFKHFAVQVRPDKWGASGAYLPDLGKRVGPYVFDIKTADNMSRFLKLLPKYCRQAALYREVLMMALAEQKGVDIDEIVPPIHVFGVILKSAPVAAAVYIPQAADMAIASREVANDLRLLRRCYAQTDWPSLPKGLNELPRCMRDPNDDE